MKFTITKKAITEALKNANAIVGNENDINLVLSSIHFDVKNGTVVLTATNGNNSFRQTIKDVKTDEDGCFLVKAKFIYNIISKIEEKEIEFNQIDANILQIKTINFSCVINLIEKYSFPLIDFDFSNWKKITLKKENVDNIVKKLIMFLPTTFDDRFNCINGVLFNCLDDNYLECITTNRIVVGYYKFKYFGDKIKIVVDAQSIKIVNDVFLNQTNVNVEVYTNNKKVIFKFENILLSFSLYDNNYPQITDKIFTKQNYHFTIETNKLLKALNRGSLFVANDPKPIANFVISDKTLNIKFNSIEIGNSFEEINFIEKNIGFIEIKLNQKMISQIISTIDSAKVTFNCNGKNLPIIITTENKNFVNLIMPFSN